MYLKGLLTKILIILFSSLFDISTGVQQQTFHVEQNKKLLGNDTNFTTFITDSEIDCARICMQNEACCIANYEGSAKTCTVPSGSYVNTEQEEGSNLLRKVITQVNLKPADCSELPACSCNGVYRIYPGNSTVGFDVYCEDGWTVFQRRFDGTINFLRNWADYKNGFGNVSGEHWLGNDKLHVLTSNKQYSLRFDLTDINDQNAYAIYSTFSVSDESLKYQMTVGGYSGTAGNSFGIHNGNKFTTMDNDNDIWFGGNCVSQREGGYWYGDCGWTNLNGKYMLGQSGWNLMIWEAFRAFDSLKSCVMKLK